MKRLIAATAMFCLASAPLFAQEVIGHASVNDERINKDILPADRPVDTGLISNSAGSNSIDDGTSRIGNTDRFDEHKDHQDRPSIERTISRNPAAAMIDNNGR